jgi:hypothetical protein
MIDRILKYGSIKALIVISIFVLVYQKIHWDPNPTHDGYVYSNALMVSKGYFPNRDFFAQYGPGAPLIQGHFLKIFGDSILTLRVFNLVLLSAISILLYILLKKYTTSNLSFLISVFWFLMHVTSWAWPSNITTFFTLCSMHLCSRKNRQTKISSVAVSFAGFLLGIAVFVRIHSMVQVFLVLLFIIVSRVPRKVIFAWFTGSLVGILLCVLILLHLGALDDYFNQSILWASQQGVYMSGDGGTRELTFLSFLLSSKWYLIVSVELVITFFLFKSVSGSGIKFRDFYQVLFSASAAVFFGYIGLSSNRSFVAENATNLKYVIGMFISMVILFFPLYALLKLRNSIRGEIAIEYLPFVIALAALTQLYSSPDGAHLWWIMPVLFVGFFSLPVLSNFLSQPFILKASYNLIFFCLILSLIDIAAGFKVQRVQLTNSIEAGMLGSESYQRTVDQTLTYLSRTVKVDSTLLNVCPSAIFSVADNRLLTFDRHVGDWDPRAIKAAEKSSFVFLCGSKSEFIDVDRFREYKLVYEKVTDDPVLGTLRLLKR